MFFTKQKTYQSKFDPPKTMTFDEQPTTKSELEALSPDYFYGTIRAFMKEKLNEYLYLPEFDNNVVVDVFKNQLDLFIDKFLELAVGI